MIPCHVLPVDCSVNLPNENPCDGTRLEKFGLVESAARTSKEFRQGENSEEQAKKKPPRSQRTGELSGVVDEIKYSMLSIPAPLTNSIDALQWQVPIDLLAGNTQILADDFETRDTSLSATLGRRVSRQWKPGQRREAIGFFGESGAFHQLRYTVNPPIRDGVPQRYDARANSGQLYFKPVIPAAYRQQIADRYSITIPLSGSFWGWAKSAAECPVFDCEGDAKALAVVGLGYAAVSGFGAFGGIERWESPIIDVGPRRSGKASKVRGDRVRVSPRLPKPLLELSAVPRRIVLVPDVDADPKTRRMVSGAWLHRAALLERRGCTVRIAYWDKSLGKGIDDVLKNHGPETVQTILDNPLTPQQYRLKIELSFDLARPNAVIDSRDMQIDAPELPKSGLVFTDAAMGTGKTKLAARETAGNTLLAPYPLRSLAKAASGPLDADYRNEGKLNRAQGAYHGDSGLSDRLTIVYDSTKNIDVTNQFAGELEDLLLDELTHGLRHMLLGATCKKDRLAIIDKFIEVVRKARRVLAFDADLTKTELDMLRELRPGDVEYYLQNRRKPDPWQVDWITVCGKDKRVGVAIEHIAQSIPAIGMMHWACDSLKTSEKIALHLEPQGIVCAIVNSDRLAQKDPLAIAAVSGDWATLDAAGVRVIVTSPSVVQGVSWEDEGRFALVAGTFSGCSISPRQMAQALSRVRAAVPRIVWAAPFRRLPGKWGNDTNPHKIKARILDVARWNSHELGSELSELSEARAIAVDWAARLIASDNLWAATPADSLRALLEHNGHSINPVGIDGGGSAYKAVSEDWEAARALALLDGDRIDRQEYDSLKVKSDFQGLSGSEALAMERYRLCEFYAIDHDALTLELIDLDDDGRFRRSVMGFEQLFAPDGEQLARKRSAAGLSMSAVDVDRSLVARAVRLKLGLPAIVELFGGDAPIDASHPALVDFAAYCRSMAGGIKSALNYTVSKTGAAQSSPVKLAGELLAQIGLPLASMRARRDGIQVRVYRLDESRMILLKEIADRRYQQRIQADPQGETYPSDKSIPEGYVSPPETPPNAGGAVDAAKTQANPPPKPLRPPALTATIETTQVNPPTGIDPYGCPICDFAA
jgi:Domain of unknown function (DUF3854)